MLPSIQRHGDIPTQKLGEGVFLKILADRETGATNLGMGWITFKPGAKSSMHKRDVEEYIYVTKGEAVVLLESGEEFVLNAGDIILIPAGTVHQHFNKSATDMEQLYIFAPQGPEKALRDLPIVKEIAC